MVLQSSAWEKHAWKMMSEISRQGQLSQRYTNHSVRSTAITVLDEAGEGYLIFYNDTQGRI